MEIHASDTTIIANEGRRITRSPARPPWNEAPVQQWRDSPHPLPCGFPKTVPWLAGRATCKHVVSSRRIPQENPRLRRETRRRIQKEHSGHPSLPPKPARSEAKGAAHINPRNIPPRSSVAGQNQKCKVLRSFGYPTILPHSLWCH